MKIDLGSFAFGSTISSGGNTPSWGTSLGQIKPDLKLTYPGYDNIVIGMVYKSIPVDKVYIPLGKGGHICNSLEDEGIQLAALFDKVYVNEVRVNAPFIMLIYKEDSNSWAGRKTLKYNTKIEYRRGKNDIVYNSDFINAAREALQLADDACWVISDIFILNQDELHMIAGIVNPYQSETFPTADIRKAAFIDAIKTTYDENPHFKQKYSDEAINSLPRHAIIPLPVSPYRPFITAIRTKPFILLAGISGTGKSRIVRKLAQVTDDIDQFENEDDRWRLQRPANFELIQVKPNWHNSMDVVGFKSNINGEHYEFTPFVDFIVKAWCYQDTPFFLCLDEMNLAPVEEYFAEFLSAIESRSIGEDGEFETDPIIKPFDNFGAELSGMMMHHFVEMGYDIPNDVENRLRKKGLTLPKNLIVMGTVNMDETTFSFSRKVLDRAMSIEMNEVDYDGFIEGRTEYNIPRLVEHNDLLVNRPISAQEVKNSIEAQSVMDFLKGVNELLEGTPFKLGYRAANEAILYVAADKAIGADNIQTALDDFTLMKILSRIEGDDSKLVTKDGNKLLDELYDLLKKDDIFGTLAKSKSLAKLDSMRKTLKRDHFVSFWG